MRNGTLPLLTPVPRYAVQSIYVPHSLGFTNSLLITNSDQYPVAVAVVLVLLSEPLSPITVHVMAIPFAGGRTTDFPPSVVVVAVVLVSEPLAAIVGRVVDIPLKGGGE